MAHQADAPPAFAREPTMARTRWLSVMWWYLRGPQPTSPLYLRTTAGTFYLVHTVKRCRPGSKTKYRFGVTRITEADVPDGAEVHEWTWTPRPRRRLT